MLRLPFDLPFSSTGISTEWLRKQPPLTDECAPRWHPFPSLFRNSMFRTPDTALTQSPYIETSSLSAHYAVHAKSEAPAESVSGRCRKPP